MEKDEFRSSRIRFHSSNTIAAERINAGDDDGVRIEFVMNVDTH